jgi:hypothetical protein
MTVAPTTDSEHLEFWLFEYFVGVKNKTTKPKTIRMSTKHQWTRSCRGENLHFATITNTSESNFVHQEIRDNIKVPKQPNSCIDIEYEEWSAIFTTSEEAENSWFSMSAPTRNVETKLSACVFHPDCRDYLVKWLAKGFAVCSSKN